MEDAIYIRQDRRQDYDGKRWKLLHILQRMHGSMHVLLMHSHGAVSESICKAIDK